MQDSGIQNIYDLRTGKIWRLSTCREGMLIEPVKKRPTSRTPSSVYISRLRTLPFNPENTMVTEI